MLDNQWSTIIADLFVNLAAGWFGAVVIAPMLANHTFFVDLTGFIANTLCGMMSLYTAYKFRTMHIYE